MAFWSLRLADALLEGLSDATIRRSWGAQDASVSRADLRGELARGSLVEGEVRRLVRADWRRRESAVVEATERLASEELIECQLEEALTRE